MKLEIGKYYKLGEEHVKYSRHYIKVTGAVDDVWCRCDALDENFNKRCGTTFKFTGEFTTPCAEGWYALYEVTPPKLFGTKCDIKLNTILSDEELRGYVKGKVIEAFNSNNASEIEKALDNLTNWREQ